MTNDNFPFNKSLLLRYIVHPDQYDQYDAVKEFIQAIREHNQ